jgi:hypothetical protein
MLRARILVKALVVMCLAALSAWAEVCPACKGLPQTKDIGACTVDGQMTTSGSFALCMGCSERLQECERCRTPLPPGAPAITEGEDGTYTHGRWTYTFTVSNKGSKSEGYRGELSYGGQALPAPKINDYARTPWGSLYWVGEPMVLFGGHSWMPRPVVSRPAGQRVTPLVPMASLVLKVKVLSAERGAPPAEAWIQEAMKAMQVPAGVGSGEQWHLLGKEPLTIMDSKHFGQTYLSLPDAGGDGPFRVQVTGARPATIEVPRAPGARKLAHHVSSSSIAALDFYFAFEVIPAE